MTVPSIHLNGTSRDELIAQNVEAFHAVRCAMDALSNAAPNARDYYVQGDNAFATARLEHVARMQLLQIVEGQLEALLEAIADA